MADQDNITLDRIVIVKAMNERYLEGKGRLGNGSEKPWTDDQKEYGAQYALTLLAGSYINPDSDETRVFPHDRQIILERVLLATMDLFEGGHGFLYHTDEVISDSTRKAIGRKIIGVVQNTEFVNEEHISRGLFVLTPGDIGGRIYRQLESVKGTWFADPKDAAPYNFEDTKRIIKELIPLIEERFSE